MSNTVKEEPSSATFVTIVFVQILTRQLRLKLIGSPDLLTPRKMPIFLFESYLISPFLGAGDRKDAPNFIDIISLAI
jgi:hypothetical protein